MTVRRGAGWAAVAVVVALVAFAPFRDGDRGGDVASGGVTGAPAASVGGASAPSSALPTAAAAGSRGTGSSGSGSGGAPSPGGTTATTTPAGAGGGAPTATTVPPDAPDLPEPTASELAVLGPLIAAMDAGQTAGIPLVLGIATAVVATGIPGDDSVPPEARPVVEALAQLIATPGTQVNEVTAQNSLALAQLDRALGALAFANPALNEAIHQTAEVLATMGRSAAPVSPPGGVLLEDLSVLLGYFVVEG